MQDGAMLRRRWCRVVVGVAGGGVQDVVEKVRVGVNERLDNVGMSLSGVCLVFFFSSRRRHTRCSRDWSSDVCSSDLATPATAATVLVPDKVPVPGFVPIATVMFPVNPVAVLPFPSWAVIWTAGVMIEIGRASCRERV